MPSSPPTLPEPQSHQPWISPVGGLSTYAAQWISALFMRVGGAAGIPIAGDVAVWQQTIAYSDLASAATKTVLSARTGEQWKVRDIFLSGGGTDFSGGGGDRLMSLSDGTTTWTVVPAATLQSLAAARWGDTGVPWPATPADMTTASAVSTDIVAAYSGGSADYAAGSCTVIVVAERTV